MTDSAQSLFEDAMDCVASECPEAHIAFLDALDNRTISVSVDDECFLIPRASTLEAKLDVRTRASVLHGLVAGETELLEVILDDRMTVVGAPEALIAGADAALLFFKGAVRCRSITPLLKRLELLAQREGQT